MTDYIGISKAYESPPLPPPAAGDEKVAPSIVPPLRAGVSRYVFRKPEMRR